MGDTIELSWELTNVLEAGGGGRGGGGRKEGVVEAGLGEGGRRR